MKNKTKIIIGSILLLTIGSCAVSAFDLVEGFRLYSNDRQEARIDNHWLVVEETGSYLKGFFSYPFKYGFLDIYYEGHNFLGDELSAICYVSLDDVYIGSYGYHYTGTSDCILIIENGVDTYYKNVDISGFYNLISGQIYVSFNADDLGTTWVTFMQISLGIR